jgi:hypothetical protein
MTDTPRRLGIASETRLDRAIDRAVRDMMHVDPRPGFRRRVLARLDPEPVQSMFSRVALVGAVIAILILAVMVILPGRRSELRPTLAQREAPPSTTAPQPAAPSNSSPSRTPVPPRRTPGLTRERIPMPRVANVFGSGRTGVAAASVDDNTVWPAPAPPQDLPGAPAPLVIPPIEPPAPLVIPPLNPRGPGL